MPKKYSPKLKFQVVKELGEVVGGQMNHYNQDRIHSSIGYVSPSSLVRRFRRGEDDI